MQIARNSLPGFVTVFAVFIIGCGGDSTTPQSADTGAASALPATSSAAATSNSDALPTTAISAGSPTTPDLNSPEAKAAAEEAARLAAPEDDGSMANEVFGGDEDDDVFVDTPENAAE